MSQGRGHFICGAIFGIALGFAVGHLLVQANVDRAADVVISLPESVDDIPPQVALLNTAGSVFDRYPVPGAEGSPTAPKVVTADAFRGGPLPPPPEEPKTLPKTDALPLPLPAAPPPPPLPSPSGAPDPELQSLLEDELQSVPLPQKEVWRDALDGVPVGDAAEIVRMWKIFGGKPGLGAPSTGTIARGSAIPEPLPTAAPRRLRDIAPSVWRQLHRDLNHAEIPGYLRSVPVLASETERGDEPLYRVALLRLDVAHAGRYSTDNPWDIAIVGDGFLQVTTDSGGALTRAGSLGVDQERRLGVQLAGTVFPLVPEVRIPADARKLVVTEDARVTILLPGQPEPKELGKLEVIAVLNPGALERHAAVAGLYVAGEAAGTPWPLSFPSGKIVQGQLERSNADQAEGRRWLERLEALAGESLLVPEQPERSAGSHPGE